MGHISFEDWAPPHVSFSTLNSYRMCGTKLYLEKIARKEQRPGLAAIGGNAVHVASEAIDAFILAHGFDALDAAPEPPAEPEVAKRASNPYASAPLDTNKSDPAPDF